MDLRGDSGKINWRDHIGNVGSKAYELFKLYNKVVFELRDLGVIRSKNNPVGDYGEFLAEKIFGLTRAPKDSKGYDLIDNEGKKYQVETRNHPIIYQDNWEDFGISMKNYLTLA